MWEINLKEGILGESVDLKNMIPHFLCGKVLIVDEKEIAFKLYHLNRVFLVE